MLHKKKALNLYIHICIVIYLPSNKPPRKHTLNFFHLFFFVTATIDIKNILTTKNNLQHQHFFKQQ